MEGKMKDRHAMRLKNFDYNSSRIYFITICTQNRRTLLSEIVGTGVLDCPRVELKEYGKIVERYINQLDAFYGNISVERYVIMPNHIHLLLHVQQSGQSRTPVPTGEINIEQAQNGQSRTPVPTGANSVVSRFVSTLKRFCNKEYGENIWQARFYDHIIRDREEYEAYTKYIYENPLSWYQDELYSK